MSVLPISIILATWWNVPAQMPVAANQLTVQPLETVAQIAPHAEGQRRIPSPKLSFSLRTQFACMGNAVPELLSIGIADTLYRHIPVAEQRSLLATIEVPAQQIAPINVGDFCVVGREPGADELFLPGVATAHVTLRCDPDSPPVLQAVSIPLPLRLICSPVYDPDVSDGAESPPS